MKKSELRHRLSFSLQTKMLALVMIPMLLVIVALVSIASYGRIQDTRISLADQRAKLIETRKVAIRNVVEVAKSTIAPIVATAGTNDAEAQEEVKEILRSMRFDDGNYIFAYDFDGNNLVLPPSPEREGTNMLDVQDSNGNYLIRGMIDIAKQGKGDFYGYEWLNPKTSTVEQKFSYADGIDKWHWMLGAGIYVTDIDEAMADIEAAAARDLRRSILMAVLVGALMFIGGSLMAIWLVRRTVQPIRRTAAAMQDIAQGKGDLTRRLKVESDDEIGNLATQFNAFASRMQDTLREVRTSTGSVYRSAGEIAQGSEELASRTEQAAANLQQTSASMEEITSTVNHSAESARQANQLVQSTAEVARQGEAAMDQVELTMNDINDSASKISDIITMIDAIAFQTNILALNASVEAARAGEHGRGFAVVAQEVRTLASRSGEASREIRQLIDTSVSHTQSGAELVRSAGQTMQKIVASVARVTDVIGEISAAAKEQSSGIGQVNTAVTELDTMTQQNAAMVQQSTTAAADMRRHAERLNQLINTFVLGEDSPTRQTPTALQVTNQASRSQVTASSPATPKVPVKRPATETADEWEAF
ncbi:methyl-accepting chemotaxis protein [Litchfieldella qijiaojingensis]|uniref:Methyl-accepting chemotaxis protein n=1 Tax=Litchfieldella qijiaojingensis TaxID=980347 RepID=A0ABQ2YR72_9GAMM|nr:methyl-accepting chemotaxis protein [Halomonas qijiaojingensis]GGX92667.1 methyl-accepting chemotaxis protein [Halomonas qijiaojingensis]